MAALAARPYDSVSLNLNGRAVRIEARDDMPLLGPLRDFLGSGEIEAKGISVLHCSPCVREWMLQEQGRPKPQPEP